MNAREESSKRTMSKTSIGSTSDELKDNSGGIYTRRFKHLKFIAESTDDSGDETGFNVFMKSSNSNSKTDKQNTDDQFLTIQNIEKYYISIFKRYINHI